jgi:Kef-type K+ transport system membrane component KefB/Trk K+ transport system NAD-binding subunit
MPFNEMGKNLAETMNIGDALRGDVGLVPEAATTMVLESIGRDLLLLLAATVVVMPVSKKLGITPILGYLIAGAILGPHGLDVFSNSKADVELGDFGILFLLFSEGLEVSSARLMKLTNYLPLGFAQISLTTAALTAAILLGVPEFLERFLPLDSGLINVNNPAEAVILALAGALSTSAFIFPVLKEKGWEEKDCGQAATSILLLQDLVVAPILVLLPYVVGQDPTDYSAIGFLTAKATIGFGSVMVVGSFVLRRIFALIAQTRSTETFVALCLLVSVGMGTIAKELGLTDTAGAFAAGVLLANTNYRAQIQAEIYPFKGILLGIFFMGAGSSFDTELVLREWPTILVGAASLIIIKAVTLFSATRVPKAVERNRLPLPDGVRIALLLSGGGEFAFVVLALAERLGVVPKDLGGLLTAIVLITMGVTPFLGDVAEAASAPLVANSNEREFDGFVPPAEQQVARDAIIVCGYDTVGRQLLNILGADAAASQQTEDRYVLPHIVAFDTSPSLVDIVLKPTPQTMAVYGDPSKPMVLRANGVTNPEAIFVTYGDHTRALLTTSMLRSAFPESPIYARAQRRSQAQSLQAAGATEVVVESDELPRSAVSLLRGASLDTFMDVFDTMDPHEIDRLVNLYACIDADESGLIDADELTAVIRKSNSGIVSDEEITAEEKWLRTIVQAPIDAKEFCRMYVRAPRSIQLALGDACLP